MKDFELKNDKLGKLFANVGLKPSKRQVTKFHRGTGIVFKCRNKQCGGDLEVARQYCNLGPERFFAYSP